MMKRAYSITRCYGKKPVLSDGEERLCTDQQMHTQTLHVCWLIYVSVGHKSMVYILVLARPH